MFENCTGKETLLFPFKIEEKRIREQKLIKVNACSRSIFNFENKQFICAYVTFNLTIKSDVAMFRMMTTKSIRNQDNNFMTGKFLVSVMHA